MKKLFDLFKTYWYELVLFSTYGAAIFYIGGLNNDGWERLAGVDGDFALSLAVMVIRLIVVVFICTKLAFLLLELTNPDDVYQKEDVWFELVNFILLVYITELAIIDILLHGI